MLHMLLIVSVGVASSAGLSPSPCDQANTCGECLTRSEKCGWCLDERDLERRCFLLADTEMSCTDVYSPQSELRILKNKPFTNRRMFMPQKASLRLRPIGTGVFEQGVIDSPELSFTFRVPLAADNSNLTIRAYSGNRLLKTRIHSNCPGAYNPDRRRNILICPNAVSGEQISFTMEAMTTRCLPGDERQLKVYGRYGNLKSVMKVKVKTICTCDCERIENSLPSAPMCLGNGNYACGACICDAGYYGKVCECEALHDDQLGVPVTHLCMSNNASLACSGRGECVCGQCACSSRRSNSAAKYSGQFCECDDYSCDYYDGTLCGGPERGHCNCGVCQCRDGYGGEACSCQLSHLSCVASNGEICNGVGECVCGHCQCHRESFYAGPTCEDCPTCPGMCVTTKPCVQCTAFRTGDYDLDQCDMNCSHLQMEIVDSLDGFGNGKQCMFRDDDDCAFKYNYSYMPGGGIRLHIVRVKECPLQ